MIRYVRKNLSTTYDYKSVGTSKPKKLKTQNMLLPKRLYTTGITLITALLLSACQKETLPIADGNKTVNITLSTKVGSDGSSTVSPEDAIHTLRIYAFDNNNELIGYHYEPNVPNSPETYSFSMPLNLSYKEDFPTGSVTAKFYVVANEGGATIKKEQNQFVFPTADFKSGEWVWSEGVTLTSPEELSALLITGYETKTESEITTDGLPMSFKDDDVEITTETNQSLEFGMERAVVKLCVNFRNEGVETTVNNISFKTFEADQGYLFRRIAKAENTHVVPEIPDGTRYTSYATPQDYVLDVPVTVGDELTKANFYQLPSNAGVNNYYISFVNNQQQFATASLEQSSIDRNTQLDIMVTLNAEEIKFGIPKVDPWKSVDTEIGLE